MAEQIYIVKFREPDDFLIRMRGDVGEWRRHRLQNAFPEAEIIPVTEANIEPIKALIDSTELEIEPTKEKA